MSYPETLSADVVKAIVRIKDDIWKKDHLSDEFPNTLLRSDVLQLLEKYCTVIYYPLDEQSNNGFHITGIPDKNGTLKHFVFLNTNQTIEKQAFTAAHELGHIWQIDQYVSKTCNVALTPELTEQIMNRFSAEVLIPKEQFVLYFENKIKDYMTVDRHITKYNLLRVIVSLMWDFFAPRKAIILRGFETGFFSDSLTNNLLQSNENTENTVKSLIVEMGYSAFQVPSRRKWINGLGELLDEAESKNSVTPQKIDSMREKFNLHTIKADESIKEESLSLEKGC